MTGKDQGLSTNAPHGAFFHARKGHIKEMQWQMNSQQPNSRM